MRSASGTFDIADLARQASVSSRTIRYYEELGLIAPAGRAGGGRRVYGPDALERLQFIARLKTLGLTLEEIRQLNLAFDAGSTPAMLDELEQMLEHHITEISSRIEELQQLGAELRNYRKRIRSKRYGGK